MNRKPTYKELMQSIKALEKELFTKDNLINTLEAKLSKLTMIRETSCWAKQKKFIAKGCEFDELVVCPSERLIEIEIENLLAADKATRADMAVALQKTQKEVKERKRAEKLLRESEEKYRDFVENANSIILRWDIEGRITYMNPYGLKFFGYGLEELIGKNVEPLSFKDIIK